MTKVAPPQQLDLATLPPTVDVRTAARMLGIGKSAAYDLIRLGQFPTPVLRMSDRLVRVPTAPLLTLLGLDTAAPHLPWRASA